MVVGFVARPLLAHKTTASTLSGSRSSKSQGFTDQVLPELSFLEEFIVIVCDSQGVPRTNGKKCANKMRADSN